jgi:xanthine dehydrogenase YagR molybdenum-binding subunit
MEPHATTVVRDRDGSYRVYDKTQGVYNTLDYLENVFGLSSDRVRVCSPFVGGAFGSGLRPQYQTFLAMMAALELERSVRVTLTRPQMFTLGYRPETIQKLVLGCDRDGRLLAIRHDVVANTSTFEDYVEMVTNWSGILYRCDNLEASHELVELDLFTPLDMRAPGGCWGVHALECALDELAAEAGVDPVELRLRNFIDHDQVEDKPFASKALKACYEQGAERFGWSRRSPEPRSLREGHELIGFGMATGIWDAMQQEAQARATLSVDGKLVVASATSDIGTGTYTVMTQIAADALGLPLDDVVFELGDTALPRSPLQGGSWTVSTVGPAVHGACRKVGETLLGHAKKMKKSPLKKAELEDVAFGDGRVYLTADPGTGVSFAEAMRAAGVTRVEETAGTDPDGDRGDYSHYAHSAVFAEVAVDEDFGTVKVRRLVNAVAAGRILNPKTAGSQILGGCVWGIGMALEEESMLDHRLGRFMNHDLAEYHVAVHADVHDVDVLFVDEHDEHVNSLGAKGVGEIGVVGVSAAIANAVYHATGKRVRELPITLDKLL